ncbi:hypothetical protein K6W21_01555 [Burkholderia latens]|nr:hypothetical protein [Burkholderia latens]
MSLRLDGPLRVEFHPSWPSGMATDRVDEGNVIPPRIAIDTAPPPGTGRFHTTIAFKACSGYPQVNIVHTVTLIASRAKITNVLTRQITYVIIDLNAVTKRCVTPQADRSLTIEGKPSLRKPATGRRDLRRESGRAQRKVAVRRASLMQDSQQHVPMAS